MEVASEPSKLLPRNSSFFADACEKSLGNGFLYLRCMVITRNLFEFLLYQCFESKCSEYFISEVRWGPTGHRESPHPDSRLMSIPHRLGGHGGEARLPDE